MGKKSFRPGRVDKDVHEAIREAAEALKQFPTSGVSPAEDFPELQALLLFARQRVEESAPKVIEYRGRRYWLRCRMAIQLEIFDSPSAALPLMAGALIHEDSFGHAPGH